MNNFSSGEKASPLNSPRRAPLTKAYSCSDASPSSSISTCAFITPKQFADLIADESNTSKVPILDCRSQIDFGCERIRLSHNINCRAKIMARKLVSKRLEDVEPNLGRSLENSDKVIIYDQSSDARTQDKIESSPINLVVQAAQKSNKKVHIIQGGIEAVKTEFPHLIEYQADLCCEKAELQLPSSPEAVDKENFRMTEIIPHVFVGNVFDAQNLDRLTQNRITHIINSTPDLPFFWENNYQYLRISVLDVPSQNIRKHFEMAIEFLEKALENEKNNILVHCSAGISRSPTLVLAYMIKKQRLTLDEAFEKMRRLRSIVDPNVSFIIQLREWEKLVFSSTETTDESAVTNSLSTSTRNPSTNHCGSTTQSKNEPKNRSDSAISVN